jgi:hypothetical protein
MTTDNFCFYFAKRLIQTSQTGGQRYSDTSPFSIPWANLPATSQCWLRPARTASGPEKFDRFSTNAIAAGGYPELQPAGPML